MIFWHRQRLDEVPQLRRELMAQLPLPRDPPPRPESIDEHDDHEDCQPDEDEIHGIPPRLARIARSIRYRVPEPSRDGTSA
jgi:hypothetical protein